LLGVVDLDAKIELIPKPMEYTPPEKWDLFSRNFKGAWHAGFNLVPEHASEGGIVTLPLVIGTVIHLANFGIFTSLIPALIKTVADLCTRDSLTDVNYHETKDFLENLRSADVEKMVADLNFNKPSSKSSIELDHKLTELNNTIVRIKEAIRNHNPSEKLDDLERNPIISAMRIDQKKLLQNYFESRTNLGKKTQQLISNSAHNLMQQNLGQGESGEHNSRMDHL
jgi:hypothetical protein